MQQVSIWVQETFYATQDIIIAGAGFTGLWTALQLKEKYPAKKITIIERGSIPCGASVGNAGFACFGSLTEIISDIKLMGVQKTMQLVNLRYLGLKMIRRNFADNLIDYKNCGGYEISDNDSCFEQMSNINQLLYPVTNLTETFVQSDEAIETFGFANTKHLVLNPLEGSLHPGKLLQVLSQLVVAKGVQILYGTELQQYEETDSAVTIYTNQKMNLKAGKLIFCTNAFTKNILPDFDITPARGQVLLTEPIAGLKINGVFHYDEGYYYFRNFHDRILLGGARNTSFETEYTFDAISTIPVQQELERFLTTVILPGQKPAITHRWAGIMGMGGDKSPIVKQLTGRTYCAVRLSGMGVALAPMIGKMVAEQLVASA